MTALHEKKQVGLAESQWSVQDGLILYKNWVYVSLDSPSISAIIIGIHGNTHEGILKTLQLMKSDFYWKGMK